MIAAPTEGRRSPLKESLRAWAPLVLGAALALGLLYLARPYLAIDDDAPAFGADTRSVFDAGPEGRIHCQSDKRGPCLAAYQRAGRPSAALWLGNSQLQAVNRYRRGEPTAPLLLHRALRARGVYLTTISLPNANLTEQRVLYDALRHDYDLSLLILPVCLDDFRETGVRNALLGEAAVPAPPTKDRSLQPVVEAQANSALERRWSLWADRTNIQNGLRHAAYTLRNRAFGIDARTKRPVAAAVYDARMAELDDWVAQVRAAGQPVLLYIPPYRRDIPGPYVDAQYQRFRADLTALAQRHGARFTDLTDAVPGREWGMIDDKVFGFLDYDFMHFTAEGHRRLADGVAGAL